MGRHCRVSPTQVDEMPPTWRMYPTLHGKHTPIKGLWLHHRGRSHCPLPFIGSEPYTPFVRCPTCKAGLSQVRHAIKAACYPPPPSPRNSGTFQIQFFIKIIMFRLDVPPWRLLR